MHLTRKDGIVVFVDSEKTDIIERLIREGAHESSEQEVDSYTERKRHLFVQHAETIGNVFYQTVSANSDGYGMGRDILKMELLARGVVLEEQFKDQKIGFLYSHPTGLTAMRSAVKLIYTMFESTKIPPEWPSYLAEADEVIVPSKWCADVFAKAGIKTTVVPLGYNDRVFGYIDRELNPDVFTFIHYDAFNMRKGFAEVFEAFTKEFKTEEPVKMIFKTVQERPPIPLLPSQYPNIEVVTGKLSEIKLRELLCSADCFVFPSRGEGFGITPLEAMATGLPAIVPNAHGISEYFNANYMLEVKATAKSPAMYSKYKGIDVGHMVMCDVADLRKKMRYAFEHQAEMHELGQKASEYVKRYTYRQTTETLAGIISKWMIAEPKADSNGKVLEVERI